MRHLIVILVLSLSTPAFADRASDGRIKKTVGAFLLAGACAATLSMTVGLGLFGKGVNGPYAGDSDIGGGIIATVSMAWVAALGIPGTWLVVSGDRDQQAPPQLTLRF
jgi:hypothetical protein